MFRKKRTSKSLFNDYRAKWQITFLTKQKGEKKVSPPILSPFHFFIFDCLFWSMQPVHGPVGDSFWSVQLLRGLIHKNYSADSHWRLMK